MIWGPANSPDLDKAPTYTDNAKWSTYFSLQGDDTSEANLYGGHIFIHTPPHIEKPHVHLMNVEFRRVGQAFRLGRYPIHFHVNGDVSGKDYTVEGCTISNTYNRAVTVHATNGVMLRNNVAFATMGHAFFTEDGNEMYNSFVSNLGLVTRKSHALLNTDTTPATFWMVHPNNVLLNNIAAGGAAYGFWYRYVALDCKDSCSTSCRVYTLGRAGLASYTLLILTFSSCPEPRPCPNWNVTVQ